MQFLIDTDSESPAGLLIASHVISIYAALQSAGDLDTVDVAEILNATAPRRLPHREPKPAAPTPPPIRPVVPLAPPAPLPPGNLPPVPVVHPEFHPDAPKPDVPAGTDDDAPDMLDPAQVFGAARGPLAPPAPVATAPAAPAAPPAVVTDAANTSATPPASTTDKAVAAERDSAGLPWDERIHSETRKKNADGTWRFRRNLDPGVKAAVHAELVAKFGPAQQVIPQQPVAVVTSAVPVPAPAPAVPVAPAPPAALSAPPPPAAGDVPVAPAPPVATATVLSFPGSTPAAPPVPVQPEVALGMPNAPQPPVVQAPATTFRDLMQKVNVALAGGKLTQAQLAEACKSAGVDGVTALAAQPGLVPAVDTYLNRWLAVAA